MTKLNLIETEIEKFEKEFSQYIRIVSVGQYDDKGVNIGFLSANELIKSFISQSLTHALTAQREEMLKQILDTAPKDRDNLAKRTEQEPTEDEKAFNDGINFANKEWRNHIQSLITKL